MYDVIIVGAGIAGACVARELSRYKLKVLLLEKDNDVACGTTKANSAIIHGGYDPKPGSLKAKFNVEGNPMFDKISEELSVPFKRTGSMVAAFTEDELKTVKELCARGEENGVTGLRILSAQETKEMEPNLNDDVKGALYAPSCGIICPFILTYAMVENAMDNGVELQVNQKVTAIRKDEDFFRVVTESGEFRSKYVVNCAGVYADEIYAMVTDDPGFKITPRRGQYYVLDKTAGSFVSMPVFQTPTKMGKGILVLPTVHGNLLVGPDSEDIDDKENLDTEKKRLDYIWEASQKTSTKIPFRSTINSFTGLRASADTGDFIIGESDRVKGFINVAGFESPGLTASPAVALHVVDIIRGLNGGLEEKVDYNPRRRPVTWFNELSDEEKKEVIEKNPAYGRVICRCEMITEGEIVDAIHRSCGATTLDGAKRRARPGMGRCQGGFCSPRVIEILARELNIDALDVVKESKNSKILTGMTKTL